MNYICQDECYERYQKNESLLPTISLQSSESTSGRAE
jgi:hypothetical protein